MSRRETPDIQRFRANKDRLIDWFDFNAHRLADKNNTALVTATIFAEMAFLIAEYRKFETPNVLTAAQKKKFDRIAALVAQVSRDHEKAIRTGVFLKVRIDMYQHWRYLVQCCEKAYKKVLDADEALETIGTTDVPGDEGSRIVFDLTGLPDVEPADTAATAAGA